jgi:peptide/nickel transport system permease protein
MSDKNSLNHKAWMRFRRNKVAMSGLVVICVAFMVAVFAYEIAPDHTPDANEQMLPLAMAPPNTRMLVLELPEAF